MKKPNINQTIIHNPSEYLKMHTLEEFEDELYHLFNLHEEWGDFIDMGIDLDPYVNGELGYFTIEIPQ